MVTKLMLGLGLLVCLAACDLPFQLGEPTTRSLESDATGALGPSATFGLHGTYTAQATSWTIGMSFVRPDRQAMTVTGKTGHVEAIVIGNQAYFRGQAFLAQHMGTDPQAQALVRAAGNAWWKGSFSLLPSMPDLTTGAAFRTTFLGAAVTKRSDNVTMDGLLTAELSGPRADIFIREEAPHYLVHVRLKPDAVIDGIAAAELSYSNFNGQLEIAPPTDVIDFSNLTTLPPIYSVVSVDTSRCTTPCAVSALVKNLGGSTGAQAPSTVTFTLKSGSTVLGTCQTQVSPDVAYNATATVSCTVNYSGPIDVGAIVTAVADNPGRA